ncbi:MAG: DUF4384 domain-containing protein [Pseudomonadota bacterium]
MNRSLAPLLAIALLTACSPLPPKSEDAKTATTPPETKPQRNISNFSDALRCMDKMYIDFGVRDVSVMLEDLSDQTRKVSAGTRDMMMTAISDQNRRSRAIELIAFGQDANNAVAFLSNAQKRSAFAVVPRYSVRGSISQLDEGVLKRQADGGLSLGSLLGVGASTSRQFNVLGLDVAMVETERLAMLPGVVSKNLTAITKEGDAVDAQATISKVGINFSSSLQRTEGNAQALRNMVDLSSVELFGRLLKLPYWRCLGADAKHPDVANEIEDWFIGMERAGELTPYFQTQLRNRGYYDGPANGKVTPALLRAVSAYRAALGMGDAASVDLAFFTAFLNAPFPPPLAQPFRDDVATPLAAPGRPRVALAAAGSSDDGFALRVQTSAPAYVYCYAQTGEGKLQRIFPNRFVNDPRVEPSAPLELPGKQGFKLLADGNGQLPVACFATPREIYNDIPAALRWGDFQNLNAVARFEDVQRMLEDVARQPIESARITLKR